MLLPSQTSRVSRAQRLACGVVAGMVLLFSSGAPAHADDDCTAISEALKQTGAIEARIEAARSKLEATPACGYLIADAARTILPPGPQRTRIIDEALESSRDWAPATGPLAIGFLKAAVLAASDPALDLPKWRERLPTNMISLRNLASPGEMRQVDEALAKPYRAMMERPFSIENCNTLPDKIPQGVRAKLVEACAARAKLLTACEPLRRPDSVAAASIEACEAERTRMAQSYPQDANDPAMANFAALIAQARNAQTRAAQAQQAERERQAAEERRRQQERNQAAEEERRLQQERDRAEADRQRRERAARPRTLSREEAALESRRLFDSSAQPSFDCGKYLGQGLDNRRPGSDLLCISPELAAADRRLGVVYRAYISRLSGGYRDAVVQAQREWVARRDMICPITFNGLLDPSLRARAIACLQRETAARIAMFR